MYFKIKDTTTFRYNGQSGYLIDNSIFRYNSENIEFLDEKQVSMSGAIMLNELSREPKDFDEIVRKVAAIFVDVSYNDLKQDMWNFFMQLVNEGYLCLGETIKLCNDFKQPKTRDKIFIPEKVNNRENTSLCHDELRSVHIEIASACNEKCVHCYIPNKYKTKLIEPALFYKIVKEARETTAINVTLSGGEPLLHPNFVDFLDKCKELDLSVNVLSNLTLMTDDIYSVMINNPLLSVQTSIYSMNADVHDSITQLKGSFDKTIAATLKLIAAGIPVQISCPIMKQNKDTFFDVVKWADLNKVSVVTEYVIFASYDHSNENLVNRLSLEEVEEVFTKQATKEYIDALRKSAKKKLLLKCDDAICSVCRFYFCISEEGDVFPCVGWKSKKLGNIRENTIKELWEKSIEIQDLRNIKWKDFPKCAECRNRGYCRVCMMKNSNEDSKGNMFCINEYHCKVASMIRAKVESYID